MKTVLEHIVEVESPPLVDLYPLPSHRLLTQQPATGKRISFTVYAGNCDSSVHDPYQEMQLEKAGATMPTGSGPAWIHPALRDFARDHCRHCQHAIDEFFDGMQSCPAAAGLLDQAFDGLDVTGQPCCMAGHPKPELEAGVRNVPPIRFLPHLPVSYGVVISDSATVSSTWRHRIAADSLFVRHLAQIDGNFYSGEKLRAFNTWEGGGICWGANNDYPQLAEITDRIYLSQPNLDLVGNHNSILDSYSTGYIYFHGFLEDFAAMGEHDACVDYRFKRIDPLTILSVDNEVNALLHVPSPDQNGSKSATAMLLSSGVPMNEQGLLLPLQRHSIVVGETFIHGYITPILPLINRCWFIQQAEGRYRGKLLGQIIPPES